MDKPRSFYTDANREAWNEAAPLHARHNQADLLEAFSKPGHVKLGDHVHRALAVAGVEGKSVVQLCCNNGCDLLSVKNLGAGDCLGVDAAEAFLEQARELASVAGHADSVRFLASDIYALPDNLSESFDIALITIGVIGWMPDLAGFFAQAARVIKPGGHLVIEDMHPVLFMYEEGEDGAPPYLAYSYFRTEPFEETSGLDYYGGERYEAKPNYSFWHRLDSIVMAGIGNGLELRHFEELAHDISFFCAELEGAEANPPLGFTMVWRKAHPAGGDN